MQGGKEWKLEKWVSLTVNESNVKTGELQIRLEWTPDVADKEEEVVQYALGGPWHILGRERQHTEPMVPPFVTPPPTDHLTAIQLLNQVQLVLRHPVVAEAVLDEPTIFPRFFQFTDSLAATDETVSEEEIESLFASIDEDGSGESHTVQLLHPLPPHYVEWPM